VSDDLLAAARALACAGLVTAFGHVAERAGDGALRITPPRPLGSLGPHDAAREVALGAAELPAGVPREAWIHDAVLRARPDVGAVCRAQPAAATAAAAAGLAIRPLHGQGAFVGPAVPVHDDARLVRSRAQGEALADALGDAPAVLLRGNGAVTVGASPGEAVARMWVLEASAELNLRAGPAARALEEDELRAWEAVAPEILGRIWAYLRAQG
jgi:ribulose-5-phosphate 4-epimerase/fuculose-1-phosphate aldolase